MSAVQSLRRVSMLCLLVACSTEQGPAPDTSPVPVAGPQGGAQTGAAGETSPASSAAGTSATGDEVPCTPELRPGDEFYVPCPDAGSTEQIPPSAVPDAGPPQALEDAGTPSEPPPDPMTLPPAVFDEGPCAERSADCSLGHAVTPLGSGSCNILGDFVSVEHQVCESCGLPTDLVDFGVVIMDCGGCTQVYREGGFTDGDPLGANACTTRSQSVSLTLTASDLDCIDVYAYVGSGEADDGGSFTQSSDQVRICRCDRATDTCTTCVDGACD